MKLDIFDPQTNDSRTAYLEVCYESGRIDGGYWLDDDTDLTAMDISLFRDVYGDEIDQLCREYSKENM